MSKQQQQFESSDSLYLNQLKFRPADRKTFMNYLLTNFRVVVLAIIAIFVIGIYSFTLLPLESNPEVKIPFGIVSVGLPGASPADVEELIIKKLEDDIVNLEGVKEVTAGASNSFASIGVEFQADQDLKESVRKLRDAVDNAKSDLPEDASDPIVTQVNFSNSPVWIMVMNGPYDNFTLRRYAEVVETELEKLPGTNDVQINGGDIAELRISIDPAKLELYGLTTTQVLNAVQSNNLTFPLGSIELSNFTYTVRMENKFLTASDLRKLPILNSNDQIVRLQDVATVLEMASDRDVINRLSVDGNPTQNAVTINVLKKSGESIIELIDSGKLKLEELQAIQLPQDIEFATILDESDFIRSDYYGLQRDGLTTIILVTIVLFLFVGLKEAFVAGITIPMVFAATFALMNIFGITLNFLSLFSLILALGLLVDDAIVVVQASKQYLRTGKFTPEEAVLLVFRDFRALILTTSLTTVFAFGPLLLSTGIIGQFIRSIPLTVSMTLISSTAMAIFINHPMVAVFERIKPNRAIFKIASAILLILFVLILIQALTAPSLLMLILLFIVGAINLGLLIWYRGSLRKKLIENEQLMLEELADPEQMKASIHEKYLSERAKNSFWNKITQGVVKMDRILPYYESFLRGTLRSGFKTFIVLFITFLLFVGAVYLPAAGILKSEFLPPADYELMYINIEGPPGLITEETEKIVRQVEEILIKEPNIQAFQSVVGSSGISFSEGGTSGSSAGQSNYAQILIDLYPQEDRPEPIKSYIYSGQLRAKIKDIEGAKIEVQELSGGPPTGADFEASFRGEDLDELEQTVNYYKDLLAEIPGTVNERASLTLSPGEFSFELKPDKLQLHNITAAQVASTIRTALSKTEVTKVLKDGEDIEVIADFEDDSIPNVNAIKNLRLINNRGQIFTISDVADVTLGSALTNISRVDQKRVINLSAAVEAPALPPEVLTEFQRITEQDPPPAGIEIVYGGQNETNTESIISILQSMVLAFILIVATLVIQFNSFRKAVLVLATIPLAITGVFYGLTIANFTLSFPALIGVLALFGIVVKNAIILIDKINLNLRVGIPFQDAIVDASKSRLEAIFLTSISTIIGMIPITLNNETWEGVGASLVFGLSTSTLLTLIVIPTLYNISFRNSAERDEKLRELKRDYRKRKKEETLRSDHLAKLNPKLVQK